MEFQKITICLDTAFDDKDLPRFFTKKWSKVFDQSEKNYSPNKEIRIKTSILRPDLCDYSDAYILVEGNIIVDKKTLTANDFKMPHNTDTNASTTNTANDNEFGQKSWFLKTMLHLSTAFQKLVKNKLTMQKI